MPDERLAVHLYRNLQRNYGEYQDLLATWGALAQERATIRHRIMLLRELLTRGRLPCRPS